MSLVRETAIPHEWDRVIGQNDEFSLVTTFGDNSDWFDVTIWNEGDDSYQIEAKRGPGHPHQDELDEALVERTDVNADKVEIVATAFMLCASNTDPFTNKFTWGTKIEG